MIATLYDIHGNLAVDLVRRSTPYEGAPEPERSRAEMLAEYTRIGL